MKVGELIEKLKALPGDLRVYASDDGILVEVSDAWVENTIDCLDVYGPKAPYVEIA